MKAIPYLAITSAISNIFNANRMACAVEMGNCYLSPSNVRHGYDIANQGGE